jgi:hydrogenase maturation protein HypF
MKLIRKKILVQGIVQGVGFRPFVYRLASAENLKGFVRNSSKGVEIEIEGGAGSAGRFVGLLKTQAPAQAKIRSIETTDTPVLRDTEFTIRESGEGDDPAVLVAPDIAVCGDCLAELFDPSDRRHRHPFINCTNCGPRYTITCGIPYDRKNTTMSAFRMCPECRAEYDNPENRRFHAQPNACPACGPKLELTDSSGRPVPCADPVAEAAALLKNGKIIAIKGLGGFHLACDAENDETVRLLRSRKGREEKPLAVMAAALEAVYAFANPSQAEKDMLASWRRPIVLLEKKFPNPLAESVSPRNRSFGVLLPYTPLHHLLMAEGFLALVMTSANVSEEPIAFRNGEAFERLRSIADYFLTHDRDIHIRNDDTVLRVAGGLPSMVRRSRGYAPQPVFLSRPAPSVLAVGGEMKNTVCLLKGDRAFVSQHIGDLENAETLESFEHSISHLGSTFGIRPVIVAHDMHPDYLSTRWALERKGVRTVAVQHHHGHVVSCLAENGREDRVIGIALDGTGYGTDGRIWGGEIMSADPSDFERLGHIANRPMPGGTSAVREPWRMAVSYLDAALRDDAGAALREFEFMESLDPLPMMKSLGSRAAGTEKIRQVRALIHSAIPMPETSSMGRLFDGIAAIAGIRSIAAYEGQAALELEMAMRPEGPGTHPMAEYGQGYAFHITEKQGLYEIDPDPVIREVYRDVINGLEAFSISWKFHAGVIASLVDVCRMVRSARGLGTVALSGGCFQNRFLLERLKSGLQKAGFEVLHHSLIPCNDGGLSLGQAVSAASRVGL